MKYNMNSIVEIKGLIWKIENKHITFEQNNQKVILNETASIIWRLFDGVNSIKAVIDKLYEKYSKENSGEYIEEIVMECISMLEQEGIIIIKEDDEFGGWFQYE